MSLLLSRAVATVKGPCRRRRFKRRDAEELEGSDGNH